jgi:hypothetical protein
MGGFVKFLYYNENAGFNQEKNQKNRNQSRLHAFESPFCLYSVEIFLPPVLSKNEKFRG